MDKDKLAELDRMWLEARIIYAEAKGKKAKEKLNEIFEKNKNNFPFILKECPSLLFYIAKYSSVNEAKGLLDYFSRECKKRKLKDIIITLFAEYCAKYAEKNENIKTALFFYDKVIDGYNHEDLFIDSINTAYSAMEISKKYKIDKKKFIKKLEDSINHYEEKKDSEEKKLDLSRVYNERTRETGIQSLFSEEDSMVPHIHYSPLHINYIKDTLSKKSAMED